MLDSLNADPKWQAVFAPQSKHLPSHRRPQRLVHPLPLPVQRLMLLEKQHGRNRLRAQPHKTRHPPSKDPKHALGRIRLVQQIHDTALALRAHDPRLDHIDRRADTRRDKPGPETREEVRQRVVRQAQGVDAHVLEGVVAGELAGRHEAGADGIGRDAPEQTRRPLLAHHAHEPVPRPLVVALLLRGEARVGLHAHVQDVARVADDAAGEAGRAGHGDQVEEGLALLRVGGGEAEFQVFVDAEADGRVGELAEEGCGEAGVEAGEALGADDVDEGAEHGFWVGGRAGLEADFYWEVC